MWKELCKPLQQLGFHPSYPISTLFVWIFYRLFNGKSCDSMKMIVYFPGMATCQASTSLVSYKSMLKFGFGLPVTQEIPSLDVLVDCKDFCCEKKNSENGLVCRFNVYWSWLVNLHKWISKS